MGSVKITGKVKRIGELFQKDTFKKRDLIVETDDQYPQIVAIEFVKEKEADLDFVEIGEKVSVDCNIRGREWKNQSGEIKYFLSLQSWKLEKVN